MKRLIACFLCGSTLALTMPIASSAASNIVKVDSTTAEAIDAIVRAEMTRQAANGISVAVGRSGQIVYARGFGYADVAAKKPVDNDTRFAIGSITKQFTSAIVMQLVHEGSVSLDAPLSSYLPEVPHAADVTVRQLLHQTSGYEDVLSTPGFAALAHSTSVTPHELVSLMGADDLNFKPGLRYQYSNTNYYLLGMIVEKMTGKPFSAALAERIIRPQKLAALTYGPPSSNDIATGYAPNSTTPATLWSSNAKYTAGALYSDPSTLVAWDNAFFGGSVVDAPSLAFLRTSGMADGLRTGYAAGWLDDALFGHRMIWHNGGVPGFNARNAVFPDDRIQIVVFTNTAGFDEGPIVNRIFARLIGGVSDAEIAASDMRPGPGEKPAETARALALFRAAVGGTFDRSLFTEASRNAISSEMLKSVATQIGTLGIVDHLVFLQTVRLRTPNHEMLFQYVAVAGTTRLIYSIGFDAAGKIGTFLFQPG